MPYNVANWRESSIEKYSSYELDISPVLFTSYLFYLLPSLIIRHLTQVNENTSEGVRCCVHTRLNYNTTNKEGRCLLLRTGHQGLSLQPCDVQCEAIRAAICSTEEAVSGVMVNWLNSLCSRVYISRCRISFNFR